MVRRGISGRSGTPQHRPGVAAFIAAALLVLLASWSIGAAGSTQVPSVPHLEASTGPGNTSGGNPPTLNYTVTFLGSGIPPGVGWSVTLGSISVANSGANVEFRSIPAGTYTFQVHPPAGYDCAPQSGSLPVGSDSRVAVSCTGTSSGSGFSLWPLAPIEVTLLLGIGGGGAAAVVGSELVVRRRAARAGAGEPGPRA